jgi:hypothetical protein
MIVRADMCRFSKTSEPQQSGPSLAIRQLGSNSLRAHWFCNFIRGMEPQTGSVAKAIVPDFYLYNEYSNYVGTLKAFRFDLINTEAEYQVLLHDQTFQCKLDLAFLGDTATFKRYADRQIVLPSGVNMQSAGGGIAGIGCPQYQKGTRIK